MQGNKHVLTWRIDGTLAANKTIPIVLPYAVTVLALIAGASNDSDATIAFGTSADQDGYLTAQVIGDSGALVTYDKDDWNGALLPTSHIADVSRLSVAANVLMNILIDFDGSAGTAAQNLHVELVVVEG